MVVTRETYQADAPLTAASVATQVVDAMADAGYGAPFDSFLDGSVENRIFKLIYDAGKTYGSTYYWFMFLPTEIRVQQVTGWNAGTHQPTGTQYLDYYSTATNTTANHMLLMSLNSSVTFSIRRWTSGIDTGFSWFVMSCGTTVVNFHINKTSPIAIYDLNKVSYHSMMWCQTQVEGTAASARFRLFPILNRRCWLGGPLRSVTGAGWYGVGWNGEPWNGEYGLRYALMGPSYHMPGNYSNQSSNAAYNETGIVLPYYFNNTNSEFTSDQTPVNHSLLLTNYSSGSLPADFGITANYNVNTAEYLSVLKVVVGGVTQKWDILRVSNSTSTPPGSASPMFLARFE